LPSFGRVRRNSRPRKYSNQHRLTRLLPAICPQKENFLAYRLIKSWNSLHQQIIQAKIVKQFENLLENFHRKEKPAEDGVLGLERV